MNSNRNFNTQKRLLCISFALFSRLASKNSEKKNAWVIGVIEIASFIHNLSKAIPNSVSVCLYEHHFYNFQYDWTAANFQFPRWQRLIKYIVKRHRTYFGPILLGYLLSRYKNFLYVYSYGFLRHEIDHREFEFAFIKKHGGNIVCYFCGNDIRSPQKEIELGRRLNLEVASNYYQFYNGHMATEEYEQQKKAIARVAETYGDHIFNAPTDQSSYLTRPCHAFFYLIDDQKIRKFPEKFKDIKKVRIVHAPSSPIIKGTQIVRAAIKKLQTQGYLFDYIEILAQKHDAVQEELLKGHVVLNEFFMFTPGVFGVEAMSSYCALLTSADEEIETTLPKGSNRAWLVTRYYEIYDKLKWLLDNPHLMLDYAEAGHNWVRENAAFSAQRERIATILNPH